MTQIADQPFARYTIATPVPDLQALTKTCMDLKQAMEQAMGRYNEPGGKGFPRMAVGPDTPTGLKSGDFWLTTGQSNVLSVNLNGKWYKVGALQP